MTDNIDAILIVSLFGLGVAIVVKDFLRQVAVKNYRDHLKTLTDDELSCKYQLSNKQGRQIVQAEANRRVRKKRLPKR